MKAALLEFRAAARLGAGGFALLAALLGACGLSAPAPWPEAPVHPSPGPTTQPAFQVDARFPTADKPQSKIWFAHGRWWALLPHTAGPSLWERSTRGWTEHIEVASSLRGLPKRGDVWSDGDGAIILTHRN